MGIPHFTLNFSPRNKSRNRIYNHYIYGAASDQHIRYFKSLLPCIGLGHQKFIAVYAYFPRIDRVKSMLSIYKSCYSAKFLRFCDCIQSKRCLS